jgi:hypothetical protein
MMRRRLSSLGLASRNKEKIISRVIFYGYCHRERSTSDLKRAAAIRVSPQRDPKRRAYKDRRGDTHSTTATPKSQRDSLFGGALFTYIERSLALTTAADPATRLGRVLICGLKAFTVVFNPVEALR